MLISIIVPTYNEAENVSIIHAGLEAALQDETWELIVVDDDSPDGTADAVRKLALQHGNVRCIQRLDRKSVV